MVVADWESVGSKSIRPETMTKVATSLLCCRSQEADGDAWMRERGMRPKIKMAGRVMHSTQGYGTLCTTQ